MGATSDFDGLATGTYCKPVLLPFSCCFGDFWRMEHLWFHPLRALRLDLLYILIHLKDNILLRGKCTKRVHCCMCFVKVLLMLFWRRVGAAHLDIFLQKCLLLEVLQIQMLLCIWDLYSLLCFHYIIIPCVRLGSVFSSLSL